MSTQIPGPPAPGTTGPQPFDRARLAVVNVDDANSDNAWKRLTKALGRDLQHGIYRAHNAARRLQALK